MLVFCPSGFVPLSVLWDRIPSANFESCYESGLQFEKDDPKYALSVTASDYLEVSFFASLGDEVHICSPVGQVLKLDYRLLRTDDFVLYDLAIDDRGRKLLEHDPEGHLAARRMFNAPAEEFISDGLIIANSYWEASRELGQQHNHFQLPLFNTRSSYTISLYMFDLLVEQKYTQTIDFRQIADYLRPFEGWSMCAPESAVGESWDRFWQEHRRQEITGKLPVKSGRPRKQEQALLEIQKVPKKVIRKMTFKELSQHLEKETGNLYSVSTLSRAMGQNSDQN